MVIRRMREHVATHNWFAVGIDLLIVILGVFLGTQVSNWNTVRGELAQAREDRKRLVADLDQNNADYANRLEYFRAVQRHALATLAALDRPGGASGEAFLIDAYQATQISPRPAKRVTYDEIVATGRLTRLGSPPLRDRVGNFYIVQGPGTNVLDYVPTYRERVRRAMPGSIQVAIRARCPERYDYLADGTSMFFAFEGRCSLGYDPATLASGVVAVRAIPDLRQELNRVIGDADVKREVLALELREMRAVREHLAAADR